MPKKIVPTGGVSEQQLETDRPKILKLHRKMLKQSPWWGMLGGSVTIDGRRYIIVP